MHHQTLRLIDHQKVIVFVDNVKIHLHRHNIHRFGFGEGQGNFIANIQFVVFLAGFSAAQNTALLNKVLRAAAAEVFHASRQKGIQALPGLIGK